MSRRYDFDSDVLDIHVERFCSEIVERYSGPRQDADPSSARLQHRGQQGGRVVASKSRFEQQNKKLGIWYSDVSYKMFVLLQADVFKEAEMNPHLQDWEFNASKIKSWIEKVNDPHNRALLQTRWEECVHICKTEPPTKSRYFSMFHDTLKAVTNKVPDLGDKVLEGLGYGKKKFKNGRVP